MKIFKDIFLKTCCFWLVKLSVNAFPCMLIVSEMKYRSDSATYYSSVETIIEEWGSLVTGICKNLL